MKVDNYLGSYQEKNKYINTRPPRRILKSRISCLQITIFCVFSLVFLSIIPSSTGQGNIEPEFTIELDSTTATIDTSVNVQEPMVQVDGMVTMKSNAPVRVEVNLTIDNDWNCTVSPNQFILTILQPVTEVDQ